MATNPIKWKTLKINMKLQDKRSLLHNNLFYIKLTDVK